MALAVLAAPVDLAVLVAHRSLATKTYRLANCLLASLAVLAVCF